jgi:hypothetical protein
VSVVNTHMAIESALFNFHRIIISHPNGDSRFQNRERFHAKGERVASHDPPLALSHPNAREVLGTLAASRRTGQSIWSLGS